MQRQVFQCPLHPEEIITNYCCLTNCLTPLCPDCIDEHIKNHKLKSQVPEVDTLTRVKKMCQNKIRFTNQALGENLERLKNASNLNPQEILKQSLDDLDQLRVKMIDQINHYFNTLEEEFTQQFKLSASKIGGGKDLEL